MLNYAMLLQWDFDKFIKHLQVVSQNLIAKKLHRRSKVQGQRSDIKTFTTHLSPVWVLMWAAKHWAFLRLLLHILQIFSLFSEATSFLLLLDLDLFFLVCFSLFSKSLSFSKSSSISYVNSITSDSLKTNCNFV